MGYVTSLKTLMGYVTSLQTLMGYVTSLQTLTVYVISLQTLMGYVISLQTLMGYVTSLQVEGLFMTAHGTAYRHPYVETIVKTVTYFTPFTTTWKSHSHSRNLLKNSKC